MIVTTSKSYSFVAEEVISPIPILISTPFNLIHAHPHSSSSLRHSTSPILILTPSSLTHPPPRLPIIQLHPSLSSHPPVSPILLLGSLSSNLV
ncbi:hypothetical protein Pmani_034269 [Petrolisthes manimaculis]|uniref:Uncharacterized protein n=1 Tax=Petrolisthes manimaculis TaxID=1843537 RepID=A0AAE1NP33_9EUCA|nr:hypothetical protein Pmani_034269 [Petrolisthes manimaculis]